MDCKTARLMLDFARPRRPELESADLEALESHLADCPECGPLAQTERQIDSRLSRAMLTLPIPEGLRDRLLTKLEAERRSRNWKRRRWLALPAAAAALLLATWLGLNWFAKPERISVERLVDVDYGKIINPRPEMVEDYFRSEGIFTIAPVNANYALLSDCYVTSLEGRRVAKLVFTDGKNSARVYILPTKHFDVAEAARNQPMDGSGWKAEIRFDPSGKYGYLVIYLGEGEPLKVFPPTSRQPDI
ncbi:MAG TPA: hypothetical protein VGX70_07060 [Gemmataceae bacterium]|nr:hypothetical protein [Gemmataceae bacterium]